MLWYHCKKYRIFIYLYSYKRSTFLKIKLFNAMKDFQEFNFINYFKFQHGKKATIF